MFGNSEGYLENHEDTNTCEVAGCGAKGSREVV